MPLVLKPGSAEPWTPYRLIQAFIGAGVPPDAFGYYPADHAGAGGDPAVVRPRHGLRRHVDDVGVGRRPAGRGPRTRIQQGRARARRQPRLPGPPRRHRRLHRRELGPLLRQRFRGVGDGERARHRRRAGARAWRSSARAPADDPDAQLAPFTDPAVAERISAMIDAGLAEAGARGRHRALPLRAAPGAVGGLDVSAAHHRAVRVARSSAGQPRVPVPVRERGAGGARGYSRSPRAQPGRDRDHRGRGAGAAAAGLAAGAPPEPRARSPRRT